MAVYNLIYGSTADGEAFRTGATYLTVRADTVATSGVTAGRGNIVNRFITPNYSHYQCFFVFDTSAVPAGSGTGTFNFNLSLSPTNTQVETVRIREVSSVANKIAGASLSALTLHSDPGTFPTALGAYSAGVIDVSAIPRSATFSVVVYPTGQESTTAPTLNSTAALDFADAVGTTGDPYLLIAAGSPWQFLGVSNVVEVTATPHALVTTGITGLAAGDLLVACISSRIASTTAITLPTGWTLVSQQLNNNTLTTTSAIPSGMMAYCVRGASDPALTFTHPVAPTVAIGRIVAYRNNASASPRDTQTSFTTAIATTPVSGTGLTTTQIEDLIVAMAAGGQEAAWSAFNATDPAGASGATVTTAPTTTWSERADSITTTGADTSLGIFDAVKLTAGATGNLTVTASMSAAHVVVAGAFKIVAAAPTGVTGTGTPAGQAGAAGGAGVSGSAGAGTPAAQSATASSVGGISGSVGAGTPAAQAAAVSGSGSVGAAAATGTGALAAQTAAVAGAGASASTGAGALAAQAATASGAGAVASTGTGALATQASAVAGAGSSVSVGSGALQAAAAVVVGAGVSASTGTGSLVAGSAEVAGTGTSAAANSGALVAEAATVAGLGVSESTGSGALQAGAAAIAGAGLVASVGTGDLVAGPATVAGDGEVIAAGAVVGSGALVAGAATLSGEGEVTGEVAPPVSVGGGYWRWPQRRPVAVEGIGYAILPQLEGEAHGTVGVIGRSAARLAIKPAAVGVRGEAGVAAAVFKGLSVAGAGASGANCTGARAIITLKGAAIGRYDDDEAAMIALLLAA